MLVGAFWLYLLVSVTSSAGTLDGGRGAWIRVPQSAETRDPVGGGEKRCATKNAARTVDISLIVFVALATLQLRCCGSILDL